MEGRDGASPPPPPTAPVSSTGSVRSPSRRGEDKPDRKKRDTRITATKVEGGRRERKTRGREGTGGMVATATTLCFRLSF